MFLVPVIAGALGVSTFVATIITIGIVLIGAVILGLLLKKKAPKQDEQPYRLSKTLEPDATRKFVLGHTAGATDLRYWEVYGSTGYDEVICVASHKITSFGAFYTEGNLETFSGSNSTGTFAGQLVKDNKLEGVTGTSLATGGGSLWTSAASMTGCAFYRLKWTYDQKKMPNGIPNKVTQVIEGAPVYDPRRDSTNGGTGTHRPDDQTTWEYSPTDSNGVPIGRNNALQMLWYLIGWRITSPQAPYDKTLVCGRGVDLSDIDFASFIAAANVCETEEYYTDVFGDTGQTHTNNEAIISSGSGGVLLDTGGVWSYHPATNDTASIAVALNEDDIVSGVTWNPRASIVDQFNQITGNFCDPSTGSLYQMMPYPIIKDATYLAEDAGLPKRQTLDLACVQDAALAQKLARIALNKSRLTGQFKATFTYKALKAQNYDCVTLTFAGLGFSTKLFRVMSMAISPDGGIEMLLQEEDAAVYTGGSVTSYVAPSAGSYYDVRQTVAISGLTVTPVGITGSGSDTVVDALSVTWTAVPGIVQSIEIQYKRTADSDWIPCPPIQYDITTYIIAPVQPSTAYDIRARTITINDVPGSWATTSQTSGNSTVINTPQIAVAAVSLGASSFTSASTTFNNTETTVQSLSITPIASSWLDVYFSCVFDYDNVNDTADFRSFNLKIYRDTTVIYSGVILTKAGFNNAQGFYVPGCTVSQGANDSTTASSHTYYAKLYATTGTTNWTVRNRYLRVTEFKR